MKHVILPLFCLFLASDAMAQDDETRGLSLMERGARLFMEGLKDELEPALEGLSELGPQLRGFVDQMGPALGEMMGQIEDWSVYHPPEILPNGDIIIRRKAPAKTPLAEGEVEL